MRILGLHASLRTFDLDLLFTASQLKASEDPEMQAFAAATLEQRNIFTNLAKHYEDIEDLETIAYARKRRADSSRDTTLMSMGKFMDSLDPRIRTRIMEMSPYKIARLPLENETQAIDDILRRLQSLPPEHPVRVSYEARLRSENEAFSAAVEEFGDIHDKYVDARTAIHQAKIEADSFRNDLYGDLVKKLGKKNAEDYFRKYTSTGTPSNDSDPVEA